MKNHFHFLVRIKEYDEIVESELTYSTVEKPKKIDPSRQFSHFFNAYTLAINKRFNRSGSLLEKPFERKLIKDENYFKNLIVDIHNSPKNKGIVNDVESYRWSSYARLISNSPTKLQREKVLNYFDGVENFIFCHQQPFQPSEG
jgi:REP element-mobilizing transposase RayT